MPYVAISVLCKITVKWLVSYNKAKEKEGVTACQRDCASKRLGQIPPSGFSAWLFPALEEMIRNPWRGSDMRTQRQ